MTLYFMQYNNYYNRIIKKLETIDEYYNTYNTIVKEGVNFNPNDNVNTQLTVNWDVDWTPDYVLVEDPKSGKFTRWFIIDSVRLRGQQYQMNLRHDIVADNLENILEADCFIEKAILPDDNPLIFNSENMTVNQIKTNEWTLKDQTNCAWICGYFSDRPEDYVAGSTSFENDVIMHGEYRTPISFDYTIPSKLADWEYYNGAVVSTSYAIYSSLNYRYNKDGPTAVYFSRFNEDLSVSVSNKVLSPTRNDATNYLRTKVGLEQPEFTVFASYINATSSTYPSGGVIGDIFINKHNTLPGILKSYDTFITTPEAEENIYKYNNKRVKFTNGSSVEYYKLIVTEEPMDSKWISVSDTSTPSLWEELYYGGFNTYANSSAIDKDTRFYVEITKKRVKISYEPITSGIYTCDINNGRHKLLDAPYRMFCMPYALDEAVYIKNGSKLIAQAPDVSLKMATALASKYSGANQIYDVQILPYCPIFSIQTDVKAELDLKENVDVYDPIYYQANSNSEKEIVGYILYPEYSSFTINIPFNKIKLNNVKMSNETDMVRLVSPNYNGTFEFNPARNNSITFFNVDCTYLPYQPYIHVNPDFSMLYGKDFNDSRGLICGGDYSITIMNDAWQTYQLQNKNYQNMFDRDIKNMEVHQNVERTRDMYNAITGSIQGGIAGAMSGAKAGPYGAIAGAVVGTATSAAAGAIDYNLSETLRNEALDYKRDMFGYQLGNIQALPQSITRTTAFTYNNKYFPVVEYYTCTDTEKNALANKIAYNSMTVMAIGKLKDYVSNTWSYKNITSKGYIKGSLIRLDINDDFHLLNEISNEIYKGVYLQ